MPLVPGNNTVGIRFECSGENRGVGFVNPLRRLLDLGPGGIINQDRIHVANEIAVFTRQSG